MTGNGRKRQRRRLGRPSRRRGDDPTQVQVCGSCWVCARLTQPTHVIPAKAGSTTPRRQGVLSVACGVRLPDGRCDCSLRPRRPARRGPEGPGARGARPPPLARSCAVSSARTSRSTTATPSLPATCACWCASVWPPATATPPYWRFVEERYGEFVLLRPRLTLHTLLLWLAPVLLLGGTGVFVWRRMRSRPSSRSHPRDGAPFSRRAEAPRRAVDQEGLGWRSDRTPALVSRRALPGRSAQFGYSAAAAVTATLALGSTPVHSQRTDAPTCSTATSPSSRHRSRP